MFNTKRIFDILFSLSGLLFFGWLVIILWLLASFDTKSNGFFFQNRVGQFGKIFKIVKLKTINPKTEEITPMGAFLRKYKIDELPQFWNVLIGEMSIVGPRPDIVGYYDFLEGENRKILELKPGLTSLASIKYANEEEILRLRENPLVYNDIVIFPDKVRMNLDYYYNHSFLGDVKIIIKTVLR